MGLVKARDKNLLGDVVHALGALKAARRNRNCCRSCREKKSRATKCPQLSAA